MAYHKEVYLFLFLPAALICYQGVPAKHRPKILLLFSYVFFFLVSRSLVVWQLYTLAVTFCGGIWIEREAGKKRKAILITGITLNLGLLAVLKYYNFFTLNLCRLAGNEDAFRAVSFLLPVGISFYTLEALGYLLDVYWKKIPAEKNPAHLALFLVFFPKLMEGPISSYKDVSPDLFAGNPVTTERFSEGGVRILWGLFKKMVVADRLNTLVGAVFGFYENYSGIVVAAAAVAYTLQLYMEFSGCMDIVIGSGKLFGVTLRENFRQPFFAQNASEFWRRWHISLGAWFKSYIFYPVSVSGIVKRCNRYGRKYFGRHGAKVITMALSLFPVWLCNGLWHGPQWNYLFYGMYYFTIILMGIILEPLFVKAASFCHIRREAGFWKAVRIGKTWLIIFTGELFFRAEGLKAGIRMFLSVFRNFNPGQLTDGTFLNLGLDMADYMAILLGVIVVTAVDAVSEKKGSAGICLKNQKFVVRWSLYYALIFGVVIFGAYGSGYQQVDLIYAGF